jgi:hypothetical protein
MHLTCDGPVIIKGKGLFTVWRVRGGARECEEKERRIEEGERRKRGGREEEERRDNRGPSISVCGPNSHWTKEGVGREESGRGGVGPVVPEEEPETVAISAETADAPGPFDEQRYGKEGGGGGRGGERGGGVAHEVGDASCKY